MLGERAARAATIRRCNGALSALVPSCVLNANKPVACCFLLPLPPAARTGDWQLHKHLYVGAGIHGILNPHPCPVPGQPGQSLSPCRVTWRRPLPLTTGACRTCCAAIRRCNGALSALVPSCVLNANKPVACCFLLPLPPAARTGDWQLHKHLHVGAGIHGILNPHPCPVPGQPGQSLSPCRVAWRRPLPLQTHCIPWQCRARKHWFFPPTTELPRERWLPQVHVRTLQRPLRDYQR
jgi:hypothetical protein